MDYDLFFYLNGAQRTLFNFVDKICQNSLDTSATQLVALMYVVKNSSCFQKDFASALSMNKSAATGLIVRMEGNGLISRIISDEDARAIKLFPTPKGLEKAIEFRDLMDEMNVFPLLEMTETEWASVSKFLKHVMKHC